MITLLRAPLVLFTRKIAWVFLALVLAAFLAWAWKYLHNPQAFPIHRVIVAGNYPHADQKKIQAVVQPLIEAGLFSTNLTAIRTQLEQLPWIESAVVTRVWPDQLKITLQEQTPIALVAEGGLITESGDVFYPAKNTLPAGLPVLHGAPSDYVKMVDAYQEFSSILHRTSLHISELWLTSTGMWSLRLSNGTEVIIGSQDSVDRLERFAQIYPHLFENRVASRVDLRYSHGLAVKWQQ